MARPEDVGLSSERLARIDDHLLRRYIAPGKIAGCLTVVARDGRVAWASALGERDKARSLPMTEDTLFRIHSMSKPITSVAIMSLYEEGHFQLDDAVTKFIPQWRDLQVYKGGNHPNWLTEPCARPMTIRDLLTHSSGLTYGFLERTNVDAAYRKLGVGGPDGTLRDMIDQLAELPLEFSPGTRWNYSVATDVLGYLVEVISGQRFDRFLEERIFAPLGMVDTGIHRVRTPTPSASPPATIAPPTRAWRVLDDPQSSAWRKPRTFFSGGGGLVSTASDYLRFAQMLLDGGALDGARILGTAHARADDDQSPAREPGPRRARDRRLQRDDLRRHRLRPRLLGGARPGARSHHQLDRRVRLGRNGVDGVLGRSGRGAGRPLHDPVHAVGHVQLPRPAALDRLRRDRRLKPPCGSSASGSALPQEVS